MVRMKRERENECDRYIKMRTCDRFLNGDCVKEQIEIIRCPL